MFELGIRLLAVGVAIGGSLYLHLPTSETIIKIVALFAAYSVLSHQIQRKGIWSANAATFFACLDSLAIAAVLTTSGHLDRFGFLVLAPIAHAASKDGASPLSMAPIAAASLIAAQTVFNSAQPLSPWLMGQAAAVLATGLLLNHRRIIVKVAQPVLPSDLESAAIVQSDEHLELRESFRKLKDLYQDLESKSRRDRLVVQLFEIKSETGERFFKRLAMRLRDLSGADSLALYTISQLSQRMVVRGTSGNYPESIRDAAIDVDLQQASKQIRMGAIQALSSLVNDSERRHYANVLIKSEGRVLGMVCLTHESGDEVSECIQILEELAEPTAELIEEEMVRQTHERRMREAELLYEITGTVSGAKTPTGLAARLTREMFDVLDVDHFGIFWIDGDQAIPASQSGFNSRFFDSISFGTGKGIKGWVDAGASEIVMDDVHADARCNSTEAVKQRVHSYAMFPIQFGDKPYGVLTVATHRVGGIEVEDVDTLRAMSTELSHAIARLEGADLEAGGLASPGEFQKAVSETKNGCIIFLEAHRRTQLVEQIGTPLFEQAIRQFGRSLRQKLPANSLVCRRSEGDFVVLLRGVSAEFAVSWSNEVSAMASFIGLKVPNSESRVPLAMRAKVADLSQQKEQISEPSVA